MAQQHGRQALRGRDPEEAHRASTPLELLYDLTYAVAFGVAADALAHHLAEGEVATAVVGFLFATFAVGWAWINYTWFASAYDNDDWALPPRRRWSRWSASSSSHSASPRCSSRSTTATPSPTT